MDKNKAIKPLITIETLVPSLEAVLENDSYDFDKYSWDIIAQFAHGVVELKTPEEMFNRVCQGLALYTWAGIEIGKSHDVERDY